MTKPNFQQTQYAFAAYIRDPGHNPAPSGVKPDRAALYRELFFNNIMSFIGTGFPVLKQVLDEAHWLELVQDFFARHRSTTPYFSDFPEEFLAFLREERDNPQDPPFLLELAHYEWVELALALAEGDVPLPNAALEQAPLQCLITLSDMAWPLAYRFPVQRINREYQPTEPTAEPTLLVVYRDRQDTVHFVELSPPTYRLLQLLDTQGSVQAKECLMQIAQELGVTDPAPILAFGADMLRDLGKRGVVGVNTVELRSRSASPCRQ
ncbi:MAG: DNA-binding domain-containing protein [Candidatus Methylumidiphilus sp.]